MMYALREILDVAVLRQMVDHEEQRQDIPFTRTALLRNSVVVTSLSLFDAIGTGFQVAITCVCVAANLVVSA